MDNFNKLFLLGKTGSMGGHFIFYDMDTKEKFEVKVGEYQLKPRDDEKLLVYNFENQKITYIYP